MKSTPLFFFLVLFNLNGYTQSFMGYVKHETPLLDSNNVVIEVIKRGESVFVFSKDPKSTTSHVNHIRTNKDGNLPQKSIYILEEAIETGDMVFSSIKDSDKKDPIIRVSNDMKETIKLSIDGKKHVIHAKQKIDIVLKAGRHSYVVTAAEIHPHFGKETVVDFKVYEWEFYSE